MPKPVILCVDDDRTILDSLKSQLYQVFSDHYYYEFAENGDDAIELMQELSTDQVDVVVIVSDWLMPGMKGDELLYQIHQKFPQVVKIMLTGQADKNSIARAFEKANLHCCLAKPWEQDALVKAINSGLAT